MNAAPRVIAIGSDHAGFDLKSELLPCLQAAGWTVLDLGTYDRAPVDYPDYAKAVGQAIQAGRAERGILICGSGVGVSVAANKLRGIRAATCHDTYSAHQGVEHDQMNILVLGARIIGDKLAEELVLTFLKADFTHEARHERRLQKVLAMESAGA